MVGQHVCRMHGGATRQALASAEDRLKALVHPAITGLQELIAKADSDSVRLSAIKDVLDRAGVRAAEQLDIAAQTMHVTVNFDHPDHANTLENTFRLPDGTA